MYNLYQKIKKNLFFQEKIPIFKLQNNTRVLQNLEGSERNNPNINPQRSVLVTFMCVSFIIFPVYF